jgi:predicted metal-dependent hydrolase
MVSQIKLGDIAVDVVLKDIKNVHLSVHPPTGRVRISAPTRMKMDTIRVFAISKLAWIRQQQKKLREQERESPREYVERESHYVWGKRYLLHVTEGVLSPAVTLTPRRIVLSMPRGSNGMQKGATLERWYRELVRESAIDLIQVWRPIVDVDVKQLFVQSMKTKWGSCNPLTGAIRLNTELAKKPKECLEYIVVHEMAHIIEPTHNLRFIALMDRFMPKWRHFRQALNRIPVRHEDWDY